MNWFAFIYFMKKDPEKINATIPAHVKYWEGLELEQFIGGPFSDNSGGLIVFQAADIEEAMEVTANDPFALEDVIENKLLKGWRVE